MDSNIVKVLLLVLSFLGIFSCKREDYCIVDNIGG